MIQCTKCLLNKETSDFYKSSHKSGHQSWCKVCAINNMKHRYKHDSAVKLGVITRERRDQDIFINISLMIREKNGCYFCKESCPQCLQFHHMDSKNKLDGVSEFCAKKNKVKFFNELAKCIVVCANCHQKIHYQIITIPKDIILCSEKIEDYCFKKGSIWYWNKDLIKYERRKFQVGPPELESGNSY